MQLLSATWQSLHNVGTLSTTREGGVSKAPYNGLNLGLHVNDSQADVLKNRSVLNNFLPNPAIWLNQIHSADVITVDQQFDFNKLHNADALYTRLVDQPLAIMTADCLPILLASNDGTEVAAIHGGWRGLEQGILEVGRPADIVFMDRPSGSEGANVLDAIAVGNIPGIASVMIDGKLRTARSRSTPPSDRIPVA